MLSSLNSSYQVVMLFLLLEYFPSITVDNHADKDLTLTFQTCILAPGLRLKPHMSAHPFQGCLCLQGDAEENPICQLCGCGCTAPNADSMHLLPCTHTHMAAKLGAKAVHAATASQLTWMGLPAWRFTEHLCSQTQPFAWVYFVV